MPTEDLKDDVFHNFDPKDSNYGADELDGRLRGVTRHLGRNMSTLLALTKQLGPPRPLTAFDLQRVREQKKRWTCDIMVFSNEETSVVCRLFVRCISKRERLISEIRPSNS